MNANAGAPSLPRATVLIVDDDESTRELLRVLLEAEGHKCSTASSGAEAVALCREHHFDCMLLDVNLGGTSGLSIAQRLGGSHSSIRPSHVFLLTGHPKEDFSRALRDGVIDGHILKPAEVERIVEVVRTSMHSRTA